MPIVVAMHRALNVSGKNLVKMEDLRSFYMSLKLRDPETYVQSGNVVFGASKLDKLTEKIEAAFERQFGFHSALILRSAAELEEVVLNNPFEGRSDVPSNKLLVTFFPSHPSDAEREKVAKLKPNREELHLRGRELYIYYPDGMGQSKLQLKTTGTARNWNGVLALLAMAKRREAAD